VASSYYELVVDTDEKFVDLVSDFVCSVYDGAIEMNSTQVIVRSEESVEPIIEAIEELSSSLGDKIKLEYTLSEYENSDWIEKYKESVAPIEAGRFYIHPSWEAPLEDKINITVDPALAFGSGHHGTTFSCLEAIGEYVETGDTLLDVGCGSGILALAAAKVGAEVSLCDTDIVSVDSAMENFKLNGASYNEIWEGSVNKTDKKYDIVLANIIADVLRAIAKPLQNSITDDGTLILSGILDKKESIVLDSYKNMRLIERKQKDEWVTLVYKRN